MQAKKAEPAEISTSTDSATTQRCAVAGPVLFVIRTGRQHHSALRREAVCIQSRALMWRSRLSGWFGDAHV